ncbi:hypothetical protein SASPL_157070 [Salvia splendens]|uniref:RNA-binding protein AU-1/Ribonuclease E/G domain-containing protein n=1 Tax=Salvia splendens TaxID=180675 RepID=A0A8X8VVN3_SALSN|nr:hypothetical protein SASPL_157070 [Salvia splendens]
MCNQRSFYSWTSSALLWGRHRALSSWAIIKRQVRGRSHRETGYFGADEELGTRNRIRLPRLQFSLLVCSINHLKLFFKGLWNTRDTSSLSKPGMREWTEIDILNVPHLTGPGKVDCCTRGNAWKNQTMHPHSVGHVVCYLYRLLRRSMLPMERVGATRQPLKLILLLTCDMEPNTIVMSFNMGENPQHQQSPCLLHLLKIFIVCGMEFAGEEILKVDAVGVYLSCLRLDIHSKAVQKLSLSAFALYSSCMCSTMIGTVLNRRLFVLLLMDDIGFNVKLEKAGIHTLLKLSFHGGDSSVLTSDPRPSFMDIRPNKRPFVFPSFCGPMEETEVISSTSDKPEEHVDFPENGALSTGVEELDEEDDDQSEDELVIDEFEHHGNQTKFDVLDILKENLNGSIVEHGVDIEKPKFVKHLNGEAEQLQSRSQPQDASIKIKENKWEQVKRGSKIIVQVIKEGLGTKGPTLTAYPKLRSRFWVLMTCCKTIGISKKISGVDRTRLRLIAKTLQPTGFGLTVRTVASGHSLEELQRDLEGLLSTWKNIVDDGKSAALAADEGVEGAVPVMLHRAMGQTLSVVQDYFNEKVESMVVDSPRTYHEVTNYLQDIAPDLCDRVELYSERTPLFDKYNIEEEINSILTKRVPLANGGYLVIEQTEALVSIDVNGGHCMLGQGTSQEKAILEVNLAAAKQIARESRLRDIGGIIVVDFIDMVDDSNKRLVYEEVKKAVERDRSTVKVSELSRNGLMEITRKRVRPSVTFMISEPCICCQATGRVEALETSFSKIEHEICRLWLVSTMDQKADLGKPKSWPRFILRVDRHMCNYLTSGKRTRLAVLSSSLKVWILLKVARGLNRGAFELKLLTDEASDKGERDSAAISVLRPKEVSPPRVTLFPIKNWKTGRK